MDIENSPSKSANSKLYGSDLFQDQKNDLRIFIRENEFQWDSILQNFAISQVFFLKISTSIIFKQKNIIKLGGKFI